MSNKVYIVNDAGHDFNPALQYGELVPLTAGDLNVLQVDRIASRMREVMFNMAQTDYLLLTGHAALIAIAVSVALSLNDVVNILIYDAKNHCYTPRRIGTRRVNASPSPSQSGQGAEG